jgi:hypothetical protein
VRVRRFDAQVRGACDHRATSASSLAR